MLVVIFIILGLPDLPFEWFNQFRLEERFGFNKSSFGLWVSDKIKGLTLGFVLMMALIGGLLWLYNFLRSFTSVLVARRFRRFHGATCDDGALAILITPLFNKLAIARR